jgi:hypothetical protein
VRLVTGAGLQLAGLLGDRVADLAQEGPDPLELDRPGNLGGSSPWRGWSHASGQEISQ